MGHAFRGGVHPPDAKHFSKDKPIADAPVPAEVTVPLSQHIGKPATCTVKVGDAVKRGQVIGEAAGFVSAAVHSPVSGTVKKILPTVTPMGMSCDGIRIENDHADTWAEGCNVERDTAGMEPKDIVDAVAGAGIVGMGGATFPTHVKLSPPTDKPIDTVILNGVECEPFLTSDHRLMLESPETIVQGLLLVMKAVKATRGIVGIEANKPDAYETLKNALADAGGPLEAKLLPVMYPQGAEKQLIVACLGREVPSGGLPMDAGVVVQNVGTAHAIYEACALGRPLTERITSVTGPGFANPGNVRVRIGTPARALMDACGFKENETKKLVFGGPMMGAAHFDPDVPVNKGMSGILALTDVETYTIRDCIRCGRCVDCCPAGLIPSQLSVLCERDHFLDTNEWNILDCIECGVCTYQCPARRPIVQWIKVAKGELAKERAREQAKAKD